MDDTHARLYSFSNLAFRCFPSPVDYLWICFLSHDRTSFFPHKLFLLQYCLNICLSTWCIFESTSNTSLDKALMQLHTFRQVHQKTRKLRCVAEVVAGVISHLRGTAGQKRAEVTGLIFLWPKMTTQHWVLSNSHLGRETKRDGLCEGDPHSHVTAGAWLGPGSARLPRVTWYISKSTLQ